jgi:hypothetical protein
MSRQAHDNRGSDPTKEEGHDNALRQPRLELDKTGIAILERLYAQSAHALSQGDLERSAILSGLIGEIHRTLVPGAQPENDNGEPITTQQAQEIARNNLSLTAGLHRALVRETSAPLKRFERLGIRIAGRNLGLKCDPDEAIQLTHEHYLFMKALPREARNDYQVVVVPASNDPYFFEGLFRKNQSHVNATGFEPIVPPSPLAYIELIRVTPLAENTETRQFGELKGFATLVASSVQAIAIAELSALRRGDTILPDERSELRAFAGYTPIVDEQYDFRDCSPSLFAITRDKLLRHFGYDSAGLRRSMACSLEWRPLHTTPQ